MIKILFFIEELRAGGAEKVLCNLVNTMDQSQFSITVQTLWPCEPSDFLKPGIRYRSCYPARSAAYRLLSRAEAALGLIYPLHIKGNYDIEVAYLECGATKIMASSTNRNAKKAAWVHCDLQKKMADPQSFAAKAKKWYQSYDKVVCVSQNVKDSFDELFGHAFDSVVLYNTIDDAEIRQKAEEVLPGFPEKQRLTAVTVGRLTQQKAFDRLLRVHAQLRQEGHPFDLWILGEGEDRQKLEAFIQDQNLSDAVKLLGYCQNPYPYIKAADLLVCSSRYEGFSTFITEGMILGKPVVTTDCTGMRELLGDSEYGFITDNHEAALLDGVRAMLTQPDLRTHYADAASARGEDFRAGALCEKTERFFRSLVKDKQ